jgi:hypothetical protein
MRIFNILFSALASFMFMGASAAHATCAEDTRRVELDRNNVVRLRSYDCRADEVRLKVEFHRLSDVAAGLVVARRPSPLLVKTLGSLRIIENSIFKSYMDLLNRFGVTVNLTREEYGTHAELRLDAAGGGGSSEPVRDQVAQNRVRVLTSWASQSSEYPAVDEHNAIRNRTIPPTVNFHYAVECRLPGDGNIDQRLVGLCRGSGAAYVITHFWRPLRAEDVAAFPRRVMAYNHSVGVQHALPPKIPRTLQFMHYVAGSNWPDDFVIVGATYGQDPTGDCGDVSNSWYFATRDIILDVAVIENAANRPIAISSIVGRLSVDERLRGAASSGTESLIGLSESLEPGGRLLIPTRINFVAPSGANAQARSASQDIHRRIGANGLRGNTTAHGFPIFRHYVYGPELALSALVANGQRIELSRRAANFVDMAMSTESGTCPFLLSRGTEDTDWTEHGKVLHKAPDRAREYTETITVRGFRPYFRLEEREAEVTHIEHAELRVLLTDGATLTLHPDHAMLAQRDGHYLKLYWGDSVEIEFRVPDGIAETDIVESTFNVTGYYERYGAQTPPFNHEPHTTWNTVSSHER